MKKFIIHFIIYAAIITVIGLLFTEPINVSAQQTPPNYRDNPAYWFSTANPTPIANPTPVAIITAAPTPTGTPASQRYYVTELTVGNSHASVDTDVQLLDGTTVRWVCPAAHGEGGCAKTFNTPLRGSNNTGWFCKSVTTGASITCSIGGYRAPF